ncbi:Sec-independent protein translocase protein TatB [Gammaproteobacteria bacterium]|nr:Sec-independent protein translocase protein TatB [Gammaproteobacteria bacterium]MDA7828800.1 Sec-independent protein translocase protein TatB [Gammaproteobacteria bacterium]MDA8982062.1 Sec-independent protein translocase protein TatB [Gammaproteobacteria bacterium]MDC1124267.1 Sec-independent protein translocase protein TatB [Gammaproteobacteria bacterium]
MFQVGFLEILLILVVGLFIVGPTRLPDVVKFVVKVYKKIQLTIANFKTDLESEIGTDEIKKDVFNEMRMEELNLSGTSKKNE